MKLFSLFIFVCIILSIFCAAVVANENDDDLSIDPLNYRSASKVDTFIDKFEQWAIANSVLYPNLVINQTNGEYSVHAKQTIRPGDLILEIPTNLLLSQDSTPSALSEVFDKHSDVIHGKSKMALRLLYEKHSNPSSLWKPYIDILPSSLNLPMFWDIEELQYMQGTWCLERIYADFQGLVEIYFSLFPLLSNEYPQIFNSQQYTLQEFLWAWGILWSRGFEVDGVQYLVPFADMLNHQNNAKTRFSRNLEHNTFEMRVDDFYAQGSEVWNNYFPRSNCDLLRLYGFILENNEVPVRIAMEISFSSKDRFLDAKNELVKRYDLGSKYFPYNEDLHYITENSASPSLVQLIALKKFKPENDNFPTSLEEIPVYPLQIKKELKKLAKSLLKKFTNSGVQYYSSERERMASIILLEEKNVLEQFLKNLPKIV